MSSIVNTDMVLISAANIIPQHQTRTVFEECVKELGGEILHGFLYIGKEKLGKLTSNSRIVLSFSTDVNNSTKTTMRNLLRDTFTRKVAVVHENYLDELRKEKERLEQQSILENELLDSIHKLEKEITTSQIGFERQNQNECDAIKGELIDSAISQGYEVVEKTTSDGVQLQFIRREY